LGFGAIGQQIARRLKAFDAHVIAVAGSSVEIGRCGMAVVVRWRTGTAKPRARGVTRQPVIAAMWPWHGLRGVKVPPNYHRSV
ncbi:hypothetical protein, partial [Rhodoplanes roseus]|uniref:hypothetical protein n=1 Tax=Rhodoplanes roseus TaxID=29409 RepID=UPI001AECADA8